ncbi:V-type proton ATPase subunit G [Exaiptasia diaphana]|uniref:V-type proton ATPase subunit G n=1 Tax=Exaiptasia diaphana TaxID=2652724 RepID=A0A913X567_EXADI|nr:V-type proton ATPase subunit G [Exaiptasia diaphana]KXJ15197.1 V-type proton ATPase subunit G [Exaiptasia diaphana]
MASHSQGIQQLLAAEKKAADLVADARKRKTKRLKQAKEEAVEEINAYKAEREKQFQEYKIEHMGSKDDFQVKIDENTQVKLTQMTDNVNKNKEAAIKRILELVYDIQPELHQNFRN